ncbi:hypothetical protein M8J76_004126 [Diaphorina citri]|nr:hypothetical protein M8J75_014477 [Diaphorina citri]KAI5716293.1 hypothetical protein M8J76_004126 [Diaphorina citri]
MPGRAAHPFICTLVKFEQPLALLGLWYLTSRLLTLTLSVLGGLRCYWLSQLFPRCNLRDFGRWAIVVIEEGTLSVSYAEELARRGLDLQLIGTTSDLAILNDFCRYLQDTYRVTARVLVCGSDQGDQTLVGCLEKKIEELESVGFLVNQMQRRPAPGSHINASDCQISAEIRSLTWTATLSKLVLRKMAAQGHCGVIVNISDPSGDYPHCFQAVHSASCAFMDRFSRSLAWEVACGRIIVQSLVPDEVDEAAHAQCNLLTIKSSVLARHAVNTLPCGRSRGYWLFAVRGFLAGCVPVWLRRYWGCYRRASCQCKCKYKCLE